jgi:hypothetical protein
VYGDSFWTYHGRGQGSYYNCAEDAPYKWDEDCPDYVGRADDIFPMPVTELIWGQSLGHAPFVTGCPVAAPDFIAGA